MNCPWTQQSIYTYTSPRTVTPRTASSLARRSLHIRKKPSGRRNLRAGVNKQLLEWSVSCVKVDDFTELDVLVLAFARRDPEDRDFRRIFQRHLLALTVSEHDDAVDVAVVLFEPLETRHETRATTTVDVVLHLSEVERLVLVEVHMARDSSVALNKVEAVASERAHDAVDFAQELLSDLHDRARCVKHDANLHCVIVARRQISLLRHEAAVALVPGTLSVATSLGHELGEDFLPVKLRLEQVFNKTLQMTRKIAALSHHRSCHHSRLTNALAGRLSHVRTVVRVMANLAEAVSDVTVFRVKSVVFTQSRVVFEDVLVELASELTIRIVDGLLGFGLGLAALDSRALRALISVIVIVAIATVIAIATAIERAITKLRARGRALRFLQLLSLEKELIVLFRALASRKAELVRKHCVLRDGQAISTEDVIHLHVIRDVEELRVTAATADRVEHDVVVHLMGEDEDLVVIGEAREEVDVAIDCSTIGRHRGDFSVTHWHQVETHRNSAYEREAVKHRLSSVGENASGIVLQLLYLVFGQHLRAVCGKLSHSNLLSLFTGIL